MTDSFAEIVGRENVRIDARSLEQFSNDSFYWPRGRICRAVIAPGSPEEVVRVVRAASAQGCAIICRGSGFSDTGGYVPHRDESVILDMRRLDRVREINVTDQYVIVEAGCTWAVLTDALNATGLRPVFRSPLASAVATIGGTITNGTADDSHGILSVEVVIGTGKLIHTGSAARVDHASPFLRQFGPDVTGLFIGDGGTFGVKTAVTLALEPSPRAIKEAAFEFETFEATMRAMVACAHQRLPGRIWATDGHSGDGGVHWMLQLTAENVSDRSAKETLRLLADPCKREGREVKGASVAIDAQRAASGGASSPTSGSADPSAAGRDVKLPKGGEALSDMGPGDSAVARHRVSSNAIVQLSAAENVATRTRQFFGTHRARMQSHHIAESYIVTARAGAIVLNISLSWQGDDPTQRIVASEVSEELRRALTDLGAAHVELAKAYAYRSALSPQFADAWIASVGLSIPTVD